MTNAGHSLIDGAVQATTQSSPSIATASETADKQILTAQQFSTEAKFTGAFRFPLA